MLGLLKEPCSALQYEEDKQLSLLLHHADLLQRGAWRDLRNAAAVAQNTATAVRKAAVM